MKQILQTLLRLMSRAILWKYRPIVVGITGSIGKSSTKEAVALVLSQKYSVRKSEGNYNNEIGIPLTILGVKSGGHSLLAWLSVGFQFLRLLLLPNTYPRVLVLELGIDHPGDMAYLVSFLPVEIGILTRIAPSHIEYFGSLSAIAAEKGKLITSLPKGGTAILNADDDLVRKLAGKTRADVMTYSIEGREADIRGEAITLKDDIRLVEGISFKLRYGDNEVPVRLPKILAPYHVGAALAAVAAGRALKVNLVAIASALAEFEPLPGRMRLLPGKNGSFLIDDTYNASPDATKAAIEVLGKLRAGRRIAILGDMLELGDESSALHRDLAPALEASGVDLALLVGEHMRELGEELLRRGWGRDRVFFFFDPDEAALSVRAILKEGDIFLVKGSQGLRLEKVSEQLLYNSEEAPLFLARQSREWKRRPFVPPAEWVEYS